MSPARRIPPPEDDDELDLEPRDPEVEYERCVEQAGYLEGLLDGSVKGPGRGVGHGRR